MSAQEGWAVLPAAIHERLRDELAGAATLDAALRHIEAARLEALGPGLLTVNLNATSPDAPADEVQLLRLWSSNPAAYPVGGRKRKTHTPWTQQLLVRAEIFVGQGEAALASAFDDHALIAALGLRAVVNVPLLAHDRCVATFNVLGTRPRWQTNEIAAVRLLAALAAPWVLLAHRDAGR